MEGYWEEAEAARRKANRKIMHATTSQRNAKTQDAVYNLYLA